MSGIYNGVVSIIQNTIRRGVRFPPHDLLLGISAIRYIEELLVSIVSPILMYGGEPPNPLSFVPFVLTGQVRTHYTPSFLSLRNHKAIWNTDRCTRYPPLDTSLHSIVLVLLVLESILVLYYSVRLHSVSPIGYLVHLCFLEKICCLYKIYR
jgi:hypothetical protein